MTRPLVGTVQVPGDKSIGHRACLLAALAVGESELRGLSNGADNGSTLNCLQALGVTLRRPGDGSLRVHGAGLRGLGVRASATALYCGNSGTTLRLLMGILAGHEGRFELSGDQSLSRRPMERVAGPLRLLGARIDLPRGDHPPVVVQGAPLRGAMVEGRVPSAQVKTAVLLAGLLAEGETSYLESVPTRDHTERMLVALGVPLRRGHEARGPTIAITPPAVLPAATWNIPGDPSSAAFFCAAALLVPGSRVALTNLCLNPTRTGFLRVLQRMGGDLEVQDERVEGGEPVGTLIVRHGPLRGVTVTADEVPGCVDELPILALLAATAEGESHFSGARELRFKESNRLAAMAALLRADGAVVDTLADGWVLAGGHRPQGGFLAACHGDHRVALCAAVLGLPAPAPITLDAPESIDVSYPGFFQVLAGLTGDSGDPPP